MKNIFLLFLVLLLSCSTEFEQPPGKKYSIRNYSIEFPGTTDSVSDIIRYGNRILALSENSIYGFKIEDREVKRYNIDLSSVEEIFPISDSLVFVSENELFSIKSIGHDSIKMQPYEYRSDIKLTGPSFKTNDYNITSCCEGEWGGTIFLKDVITNRTYSTALSCLVNVDTFDNAIYVFRQLNHISPSFSVGRIGDVQSLYEVVGEEKCNWYHSIHNDDEEVSDSLLIGNSEANISLFDTIGMRIAHGYVDQGEIQLLELDGNKMQLLNVHQGNKLEVSRTLVAVEEKSLKAIRKMFKDNVTVACYVPIVGIRDHNARELTHIININKREKTIDVYEVN